VGDHQVALAGAAGDRGPPGIALQRAAGTGTLMRAPTLCRYAQAAECADAEVLPIDNDLWRLRRLVG